MREMKNSGIEWIGEIPANWETDRLQWHLEEIKVQNSPVQCENVLSLTIEAGIIPYEDKGNQGNKAKEKLDEYKLAYNDTLVVNSMNVIIGAVGISKYFGCVSPVYYVFKATEGTDLQYIYYLFTNVGFQKEMRKYAKGILEIRLRISATDLLKRIVPCPTYKEQCEISAFLDRKCAEIDSVIEKTKATIEDYKKLKQSVITEAVTKGVRGERPMKDSGIECIGEIPVEWNEIKLKYCTYIRARLGWKGLKADEYVDEGYPLLSAFNIINNKLDFTEVNYINQFRYDESPEIKLSIDDILLVKDGAGIGKCAIVEQMPISSTPNGSLAVVTVTAHLEPKFLYYYFLSTMFQKYIDQIKDGMGVPHLFQADLREIQVVFCASKEQKEIVKYLDKKCAEMDTVIAKKTVFLEELESYKKSVIYEYVTGKKEVE